MTETPGVARTSGPGHPRFTTHTPDPTSTPKRRTVRHLKHGHPDVGKRHTTALMLTLQDRPDNTDWMWFQ